MEDVDGHVVLLRESHDGVAGPVEKRIDLQDAMGGIALRK
jgi:hypothetical protein